MMHFLLHLPLQSLLVFCIFKLFISKQHSRQVFMSALTQTPMLGVAKFSATCMRDFSKGGIMYAASDRTGWFFYCY
jgi:hypothetical protein